MAQLVLLKTLYERDKALQIKVLLDKNEVASKINYARNSLEMTYGQDTSNEIQVYVFENELDKAHEIIGNLFDDIEDEMDISDYSVEELKDILLNKDDWHESFVNSAKDELKERGEHLSDMKIQKNLSKKIEDVKRGVPLTNLNYFLLWFLCSFGFLLGLAAAYFLWQAKTRASDGNKYYLYDAKARTQGKWMLIVGIFLSIIGATLIVKYLPNYYY